MNIHYFQSTNDNAKLYKFWRTCCENMLLVDEVKVKVKGQIRIWQ